MNVIVEEEEKSEEEEMEEEREVREAINYPDLPLTKKNEIRLY